MGRARRDTLSVSDLKGTSMHTCSSSCVRAANEVRKCDSAGRDVATHDRDVQGEGKHRQTVYNTHA